MAVAFCKHALFLGLILALSSVKVLLLALSIKICTDHEILPFLIKFSSHSAPTRIEELTAGSDEKHSAAPPGIEPRVLRILVARYNHWATKPQRELRVNSSIFVGAEREESLIRNDPDKSEFTTSLLIFFLQMRETFKTEYSILATLPPHRGIMRMMAFFYDRLGESLPNMAQFDALRDHARSISLLLVLEYHPNNLAQVSQRLRESGQLTVSAQALHWTF